MRRTRSTAPLNRRALVSVIGAALLAVSAACAGESQHAAAEITFISSRDGNPEIYSTDPSGETFNRLTNSKGLESSPLLSPDKQSIAFLSDRNDGVLDLFVMHSDGTAEQRAVETDGTRTSLAWAPDSNRIAYVAIKDGKTDIYIVDLEARQELQLTNDDAIEELGSWSPDGTWVVYAVVGPEESVQGIYKKNPDGVNEVRLSERPDFKPRWSPNGKRIAFESKRASEEREIFVIDQDGKNEINVSNEAGEDYDFDWSHDSKRLVFASEREGNTDAPEIYIVTIGGKDPVRLTNNRAIDLNPRWSPDGKKIVFTSDVDGDFDLFVMGDDGSGQSRVTSTDSNEKAPDW